MENQSVFYKRLCEMASPLGGTANTVARKVGLSNATATKWKNGAIPNGETLCAIADYLDCSVDYLLGRTDNPQAHKAVEPVQPTQRRRISPDELARRIADILNEDEAAN